jgi:hypothetical protein
MNNDIKHPLMFLILGIIILIIAYIDDSLAFAAVGGFCIGACFFITPIKVDPNVQ